MDILDKLLRAEILPFLIGALAIVVFGCLAIIKAIIRHRERIAMIQQGMHPDGDPHRNNPELKDTAEL